MTKDFEQWLGEGEELYNGLLGEYREIESQIEDLERKLTAKQSEINQIAAIIGKAPMEGALRVSTQVITGEVVEDYGSASANNIARALNGRLGR